MFFGLIFGVAKMASSDGLERCAKCSKDITRAKPIFCTGCNLPHHPSCASQMPTLSDGSFTRCCKPRSSSPSVQNQLAARRQEGEVNIALVYRQGVPMIVKVPTLKRTTTVTLQVGEPLAT